MTEKVIKKETDIFGIPDEGEAVLQHPWKLSRDRCILNHLNEMDLHHIADIGVNDMYYTKKVKQLFSDATVYAVDVFFPEDSEIRDDIICVNDIKKLPDELDCIIMMDVLEHIEDDKSFFDIVAGKLAKGGIILITVPAWQFLFSSFDEYSLHYRRYNRKQLKEVLIHDGIKIEKCHYFYTCLFLFRFVSKLRKKRYVGDDLDWKYPENSIITIITKMILNIDFGLNKILDKIGIHPAGLSLMAVCYKK